MNPFEVWTEGYMATGESGTAVFHGIFYGDTFEDAVRAFRDSLTDEYSRKCIDLARMTFWGCRFFDNGSAARTNFG